MRIQPRAIASFLKNPDPGFRAILIYGGDEGIVRERLKHCLEARGIPFGDPFQHDAFSADQIYSDRGSFFDATHATSMMGGARGVTVTGAGDKATAILKDYLKAPNEDCTVILAAGELSRGRSSLVKLFEAEENAAAIACYEDTGQDREALILEELKANSVSIDPDALDYAVSALDGSGVDRGVARSEAQKLALYGLEGSRLTVEDVKSALGAQGDVALDDLVQAIASGNVALVDQDLERAAAEGLSGVALLRVLTTHFLRLLGLRRKLDSGIDLDSVIKGARPPIFFKKVDGFKRQVRAWKEPLIKTQLVEFAQVETALKQTGSDEWSLTQRVALQTAVIARRAMR